MCGNHVFSPLGSCPSLWGTESVTYRLPQERSFGTLIHLQLPDRLRGVVSKSFGLLRNENRAVRETRKSFRVFRESSACRSPVVPESIEKRHPPEPDILCSLSDDSRVAFELVEVCHRENAVFFGSAGVIGDLLEKTYVELPSELEEAL